MIGKVRSRTVSNSETEKSVVELSDQLSAESWQQSAVDDVTVTSRHNL